MYEVPLNMKHCSMLLVTLMCVHVRNDQFRLIILFSQQCEVVKMMTVMRIRILILVSIHNAMQSL